MYEFKDRNQTPASADLLSAPRISDVSWDEVQRHVRKAHALRSLYLAAWLKRTWRTWASVFRRPGRLSHGGRTGSATA